MIFKTKYPISKE